jgi:hypothetical protein
MSRNILTLVSLFILALGVPTSAQQDDKKREEDQKKIRELIESTLNRQPQPGEHVIGGSTEQSPPIPVKRKFNHKIKIETKYDKFSDTTDVQMMHTEVFSAHGREAQRITMTVLFTYQGETPAKPGRVTIAFNSMSPEWKYLRERDLTIIADGKKAGTVTTELINTRIERDGSVTETLSIWMATDVFLFMVNAGDVEMKLGAAEFSLHSEQLEALRDFASRMQP